MCDISKNLKNGVAAAHKAVGTFFFSQKKSHMLDCIFSPVKNTKWQRTYEYRVQTKQDQDLSKAKLGIVHSSMTLDGRQHRQHRVRMPSDQSLAQRAIKFNVLYIYIYTYIYANLSTHSICTFHTHSVVREGKYVL